MWISSGKWTHVTTQSVRPSPPPSTLASGSLAQCIARRHCSTAGRAAPLRIQSWICRGQQHALDELHVRDRCWKSNLQNGTRSDDVLHGKTRKIFENGLPSLTWNFSCDQHANQSELNQTNDGFLNSILGDDDLLMDMNINEGECRLITEKKIWFSRIVEEIHWNLSEGVQSRKKYSEAEKKKKNIFMEAAHTSVKII